VQDTVQQQLIDVIVKAYESANAFLIANGVMQEIDLKSFVRRTGNAAGAGNSAGFNTSFAGGVASATAPMDGGGGGGSQQRPGYGTQAPQHSHQSQPQAPCRCPLARRRSAARR
jgi:hypothetical protein